ncbi:MAG: TolC family protein [Phycisphaerales bacterium]|nr:TolC family protein [Phycisphaerales bacterium]
MNVQTRPRFGRVAMLSIGSGVVINLLVGCQSYERAPLDLEAHRLDVAARLARPEPLEAFAARLAAQDGLVPDRFDQADGLSCAEAEVVALFFNPDLRLARLEAGVARATHEHAGRWEDPEFGFDGAEIMNPSAPFLYGLTLNLTMPVSGRLGIEMDRAGAAYEAQLRRIVDAEWSTRARVRRAWAAWSVAVERTALLRDVVAQVERISAITDQLERAGELSHPESRLFRIERASRAAALADAELAREQARLALLRLMGLVPDTSVTLHPSLTTVELVPPEEPMQRLIEANTQLAIQRAAYLVAEHTLRLEVRKQFPDITIGTGYGSEANDDRLLLGLSLPLPLINANRAGIAEARAHRELARAHAESAFERVSHEYASAIASHQAAQRQRAQYEGHIVPMLTEQSQEIEQIAQLGEVDALLLLETVTRQFEAKSQLLALKRAELDAAITIAELLGPAQRPLPAPVEPSTPDQAIETRIRPSVGDAS